MRGDLCSATLSDLLEDIEKRTEVCAMELSEGKQCD